MGERHNTMTAPRILATWREALATRCENALILAQVTCQDARELLAYVQALEEENARLQAMFSKTGAPIPCAPFKAGEQKPSDLLPFGEWDES